MSAQRAKGTRWETEIVRALHAAGFVHAERRALRGTGDRGDITGIPGLVIEAKNHRRTELAAWVDEATAERDRDGARYAAVWHHRRGHARPEQGYVTMTGSDFLRLLADAYAIDASAPDQTRCDHTWPPELDDSAVCQTCGLPYAEWSR